MNKPKEIILAVTASIAAYKACDIARLLKKDGFRVSVVMSPDAVKFISPLTLAGLSRNKVYSRMFEDMDSWDIEHISLAQRGDLILIAPATANIIAKLACGICDDLISCIVLASRAPVLVAPAMNDLMYSHCLTQENIARLKKIDYKFIGPRKGILATGKPGMGHLAEVEDIVKEAKRILAR